MDFPSLKDPEFVRPFAVICAIVTAVALATAMVIYLFKVVLLLVISCVLCVLFRTIADPLARRLPGPRSVYVILTFLVALGAFGGLVALFVVPLVDQAEHVVREIPRLIAKVQGFLDATAVPSSQPLLPITIPTPTVPPETANVKDAMAERLPAVAATSVPWLIDTLESAFDTLGAVFFGLFMALAPDAHREGFQRLFPDWLQPRIRALIDEAFDTIRAWLGAIAIGMSLVGTLTTFGLYAIGVEDWLVFGAFSAGMEIIPYAGPFLGFVGPFVACFLFGTPKQALLVLLLYLGVQALMMNVIYPYLVKRRTDIPASLAIASILLLGRACGPIGVVAAVPFVAIAIAALRTIPERALPRFGAPLAPARAGG